MINYSIEKINSTDHLVLVQGRVVGFILDYHDTLTNERMYHSEYIPQAGSKFFNINPQTTLLIDLRDLRDPSIKTCRFSNAFSFITRSFVSEMNNGKRA